MTYADWKAPSEDGQCLIWPAPEELLRQTRENQQRLSTATCLIQNMPLNELRRKTRRWVGHDDSKPLIATGHQTELHHPGVWVKNAMINGVAKAIGGEAYHLAVDTDEPKHLHLRWPSREVGSGQSAVGSEDVAITDGPGLSSAAWAELVESPSPAHLREVQRKIEADASGWTFEPVIGAFFDALRRGAMEPGPLPNVLTAAVHELDWSLGLRHHALLASPLWQSESFLIFVHHVLANAREFAAKYDGALAEYRRENRIKSAGRPMPDLAVDGDRIEAPFWLDDLQSGTRKRLTVSPRGLSIADEFFEFDAKISAEDAAHKLISFLRRHHARISPRALTLTMFVRLLLTDQFVHGIGGGRYDQITDRIINSFFGIEAPAFSVTTATLYFPDAVGRSRACVPCVVQEGHRLKHSLLGPRKQAMIAAMEASPRRSMARARIFSQMHRELDAMQASSSAIAEWNSRLREMKVRAEEDRVLFDRELFYGLQSRERLRMLIEQQNFAFAR